MKLLALDTSSIACSVAVQLGDAVFERHEEQPREHTQLLMPMIRSVLEEAEIELSALDGIVLGNGPGSFIGMRIAASVAQGLAHGAGLEIAPVSSMAAVAAEVAAAEPSRGARVVVAQDAHMQEVYLGLYSIVDAELTNVVPERLQPCEAVVELDAELDDGSDYIAAGFGWQRFPVLLEANRGNLQGISEVLYPHARFLLKLGSEAFERGESLAAQDVIPAYLRQKVAEVPRGKEG
jgi:tRNA threonylcarbamoyladenosine biosynthesis protein TsaB